MPNSNFNHDSIQDAYQVGNTVVSSLAPWLAEHTSQSEKHQHQIKMVEVTEAIAIARGWHHEKPPWCGSHTQPSDDYLAATQKCIDVYLLSQGPRGGINGIGWWQWANGYAAISLHDYWSGSNKNYQCLAGALRKCESQHRNFINEFNDDTLWFAICCTHAYSIGGDPWFLSRARQVWQYLNDRNSVCGRGWFNCCDHDMEGGVFWTTKPGEGYLNSITTGLYAELSVRLALLEPPGAPVDQRGHQHFLGLRKLIQQGHKQGGAEEYLEEARCSLGWILRCVYRPKDAVVMDGISTKDGRLTNWTFTYTTGVTIGVCALLYQATHEDDYMVLACHMAHRAMRNRGWVKENGVLVDLGAWGRAPGEPARNGDGVGFKSVLMRHLGTLYHTIRLTAVQLPLALQTAGLIKDFVSINYRSQVERNTNGRGQYGPWWDGPYDAATSHSQLAVLDVMAAARLVFEEGRHGV
ncbi:hypothetical protein LTR56_019398 [Elasticomyces elasticus]|nr:hypothetical protein LTR22_023424 [Elasticomyces elasticus]KAK3627074.1 hypothetical protein LTR56_019398 [Elasticomyces elasticus]KAK4904718.1 hypothetical protein LTR49_025889 [Elasticomyces elasticus]KAK5746526.1 hypothetical protein LTS12_022709 [Elasticomyces elasticus]